MTAKPSAEVAKARAELASALDAIEDKLNVPKQARRIGVRLKGFRTEHPMVSATIVTGVTVVAAASIWCGVVLVRQRR